MNKLEEGQLLSYLRKILIKPLGLPVVCPITNQQKSYPFEVALPDGLAIQGVILTDQVKSLDWRARRFQVVDQAPEIIVSECLDYIHTFL